MTVYSLTFSFHVCKTTQNVRDSTILLNVTICNITVLLTFINSPLKQAWPVSPCSFVNSTVAEHYSTASVCPNTQHTLHKLQWNGWIHWKPFVCCKEATERGKGGIVLFTFIGLYSLNSSWREEGGRGLQNEWERWAEQVTFVQEQVNEQQKEQNGHIRALKNCGLTLRPGHTVMFEEKENEETQRTVRYWNMEWRLGGIHKKQQYFKTPHRMEDLEGVRLKKRDKGYNDHFIIKDTCWRLKYTLCSLDLGYRLLVINTRFNGELKYFNNSRDISARNYGCLMYSCIQRFAKKTPLIKLQILMVKISAHHPQGTHLDTAYFSFQSTVSIELQSLTYYINGNTIYKMAYTICPGFKRNIIKHMFTFSEYGCAKVFSVQDLYLLSMIKTKCVIWPELLPDIIMTSKPLKLFENSFFHIMWACYDEQTNRNTQVLHLHSLKLPFADKGLCCDNMTEPHTLLLKIFIPEEFSSNMLPRCLLPNTNAPHSVNQRLLNRLFSCGWKWIVQERRSSEPGLVNSGFYIYWKIQENNKNKNKNLYKKNKIFRFDF